MKHLVIALAAPLLVGGRSSGSAQTAPSLRFEEYPAPTASAPLASDIDLSDPMARHYLTLLREELAKGPDFAGHFRVVTIGMGTNLVSVVLLDTSRGTIFSPPQLESIFFPYPEEPSVEARYGITRRPDSRLLVVRGVPANVESLGTFFFQLEGTRLRFLRGFRWPSRFNAR